jgi:hypothetical protein
MDSSDLIKQKRDRVVSNSYYGQTKASNKTMPSTFDALRSLKFGPRRVFYNNVTVLRACGGNCTVEQQ